MQQKTDKHISIKTYILITVIMLVSLSLIAVFFVSFFFVKNRLTSRVVNGIAADSKTISEDVKAYGTEELINRGRLFYEVEENAKKNNGRIMIISRDYHILQDTDNSHTDRLIISRNIMRVMTGKIDKMINHVDNNVEVINPIESDGNVMGVVISTASLYDTNTSLMKQFIIIGAVILLVLFIDILIIIRIARGAVSDLEDINEQMIHTVQGNLQEGLSRQRFSETQEFADSFNEVLSKLSTIDQTRSEFVSNVSHELKTPITSMKVLAESIIENEGADVDDYKEFMTDIVDEIDRETKIINDLLALVKTDSQNNQMNYEESDINNMMETIVKTVTPLAKQRSIDISYEGYREVTAEVDVVKLSLAISNLVENAVKYNIESGWIRCSLNADHKFFYIKVADSGVGIPDDAKDKVFEKFYRVDKARSRDTGGTGLGLSITRNIINAHRGTIKLYSESGKGTTFTVRIPLRQNKAKIQEIKAEESTSELKTEVKDA
ncbi:Signal transduction histidine kinase [Lachnospiraceae bacterium]|nr:Signal transduction histidine kinase [Lachnospiraceae bacterium]